MNIGIIGCGWLGKDLTKSLINQEHKVFGTKTSIKGIEELAQKGIQGTLLTLEENSIEVAEKHLFEEAEILVVSITPRIRTRSSDVAINEMKILTDFLTALPNNPHIIYLNSTAVYSSETGNCTEDLTLLKSPYSDFEKIITKTERYTILRLAGLVGADRIIINRMAGKERELSETAVINLVAKEDVIKVIENVISNLQNASSQIFNVCSSDHPLKHIFYTKMCKKAGLPVPKFKLNKEQELKKVDNSKIKSFLTTELEYPKIEDYFNEILNNKL